MTRPYDWDRDAGGWHEGRYYHGRQWHRDNLEVLFAISRTLALLMLAVGVPALIVTLSH